MLSMVKHINFTFNIFILNELNIVFFLSLMNMKGDFKDAEVDISNNNLMTLDETVFSRMLETMKPRKGTINVTESTAKDFYRKS